MLKTDNLSWYLHTHISWLQISFFCCINTILSTQNQSCFVKARSEELSQEKNERQWLERDLEEASRRLAMAHQDIRRLTNELDAAKNNNIDSSGMFSFTYGT